MDNKSSPLKLKLYLLSSADAEQRQDQRQLPVEDKKDGSSEGMSIYISGLTIRRNNYVGNIKPEDFSECLGKANQFLERQYGKEVDETPCSNQDGRNRVVQDTTELSRWRAPPRLSGINKEDTSKRSGGGGAGWKRSPIPPVMQTPWWSRADQTIQGDGKHPNQTNKPNWVTEQTPIKIHIVRWTPTINHVDLEKGHTRPL